MWEHAEEGRSYYATLRHFLVAHVENRMAVNPAKVVSWLLGSGTGDGGVCEKLKLTIWSEPEMVVCSFATVV
jgi:hypothetical protein